MTCLSTTKFSFLRYPACLGRSEFGHKDDEHRYPIKSPGLQELFKVCCIILLIGSFRDQNLLKGQSSMPQ